MSRSYRFFCRNSATTQKLAENQVVLDEADEPEIFYQLTKVLRAKKDDMVIFSGIRQVVSGFELVAGNLAGVPVFFDFFYRIEEISKKELKLNFEKKVVNRNELSFHLGFLLCLPNRPEKLEFILQKAVELGVSEIVLVKSDFSQMKHELRPDRLQKIIIEAAEQSERAIIPTLHLESNLKDFLAQTAQNAPQKIPHIWTAMERLEQTSSLISLLQKNKPLNELSLLVGPEGGFSNEEKELIQRLNLTCFSLGQRILRMETAAIVALGVIAHIH